MSTSVLNNTEKTIEAFIDYGDPGQSFWEQYAVLWAESSSCSAFQSPNYLQYLTRQAEGTIAVYQFYHRRVLKGAAFFHKIGGAYYFLSDFKTDHNFFVIRRDSSEDLIQQFFNRFLEEVKVENWALTLNNQPTWSVYWEVFLLSLQKSRLYHDALAYSVCPMMAMESPQVIAKRLTKSKNTRYKKNRFQKEHEAEFEIFHDDQDLDDWVRDFAEAHIVRWSTTNTPSEYLDPKQQEFLKECLLAWIDDGILVRFSIKVKEKRVALCIGLKERDALIHHSHTYDQEYSKYSPGKVLLYNIGKWMGENGFSTLDFGDGNEPFKYKYANQDQALYRVFISSPYNLSYRIKAKTIKTIRQNNHVYELYLDRIKPYLP